MALFVKVVAGPVPHTEFQTPDNTVLKFGRTAPSNIRLHDAKCSREHCRVSYVGGQVRVEDLGSRNGTFVNGRKIGSETILQSGDKVKIGDCEFVFAETAEKSVAPVAIIDSTPAPIGPIRPEEVTEHASSLLKETRAAEHEDPDRSESKSPPENRGGSPPSVAMPSAAKFPPAPTAALASDKTSEGWWVRFADGQESGPHHLTELRDAIEIGEIQAHTMVRRPDWNEWRTASEVAELTSFFSAADGTREDLDRRGPEYTAASAIGSQQDKGIPCEEHVVSEPSVPNAPTLPSSNESAARSSALPISSLEDGDSAAKPGTNVVQGASQSRGSGGPEASGMKPDVTELPSSEFVESAQASGVAQVLPHQSTPGTASLVNATNVGKDLAIPAEAPHSSEKSPQSKVAPTPHPQSVHSLSLTDSSVGVTPGLVNVPSVNSGLTDLQQSPSPVTTPCQADGVVSHAAVERKTTSARPSQPEAPPSDAGRSTKPPSHKPVLLGIKPEDKATLSLIAGIACLLCGCLTAIPSFAFGIQALRELGPWTAINSTARSRAWAGMGLSIVLCFILIGIVGHVVNPAGDRSNSPSGCTIVQEDAEEPPKDVEHVRARHSLSMKKGHWYELQGEFQNRVETWYVVRDGDAKFVFRPSKDLRGLQNGTRLKSVVGKFTGFQEFKTVLGVSMDLPCFVNARVTVD